MDITRQHRGPFLVAVAASAAAVGLAIGPNWGGPYEPTLAVLTATLIALVWYTLFSYCALHPNVPLAVKFTVARGSHRSIIIHASNQDSTRSIECRWRVLGARNGKPFDTGGSLNGGGSVFTLRPGEVREHSLSLAPAVGVSGSPYGPRVELGEATSAVLCTDFAWCDDRGNSGYIGPDYYAVGVLDLNITRFVVASIGEDAWRRQGGAGTPRIAIKALTTPVGI